MPLSAGTRVGSYEILASIGAGGMGEVYRARDTKLNRDIALKILPEAFAHDPDRIPPFEREGRCWLHSTIPISPRSTAWKNRTVFARW